MAERTFEEFAAALRLSRVIGWCSHCHICCPRSMLYKGIMDLHHYCVDCLDLKEYKKGELKPLT